MAVEHVDVPRLVGLTVEEALLLGHRAGVVVTSRDVDGPPLAALTLPGVWVVVGQEPLPGARVPRAAAVVVDFEEQDGEGGVREPLRPAPLPLEGRKYAEDPRPEVFDQPASEPFQT